MRIRRPRFMALNLVFLFLALYACDQKKKYWVYFEPSILKNEAALILSDSNLSLEYYSNWLAAGTVVMKDSDVDGIRLHPQVIRVQPVLTGLKLKRSQLASDKMSFALEQVEGDAFVQNGLNGKGVKIGIIDGGFLEANEKSILAHFFRDSLVKAYKDFITPDLPNFSGSKVLDDGHGVDVWVNLGGIHPERGVQLGLATKSAYYLARTDHGKGDTRSEEEYLVAALEWMDSLGVKLVNISLGYTDGFEDPLHNHLPAEMDGQSTAITRACQYAYEQRGMTLVISAGNDGAKPWKVISAPADARGVISVGATSYKYWDKAPYSSIGPVDLNFLKPNIACFSYNGTSFSAPIVTGIIACMMQRKPELNAVEIKELIDRSGHLYPYGNNYVGYGIPSCRRILQLLDGEDSIEPVLLSSKARRLTLQMPDSSGWAVVWQKTDSIHVTKQLRVPYTNGRLQLARQKHIAQTTVSVKKQVHEIIWKK